MGAKAFSLPTAPRCLRTARYGRTMRDLRRTGSVSGWHRRSRPISESEMASEALSVVGRLKSTRSMVKAMCPGNRRRKWVGEGSRRRRLGRERTAVSKDGRWISSLSEIPVHFRPRRPSDRINLMGAKKVHSLIDKVYKRKNLEMAWKRCRLTGAVGESMEDAGGVLSAAGSATGSVAQGASGRCPSTPPGAAGANPESGQARRVSQVKKIHDL